MTELQQLRKDLAALAFRVERLERMQVPAPATSAPWFPPPPTRAPYTGNPKGGAA